MDLRQMSIDISSSLAQYEQELEEMVSKNERTKEEITEEYKAASAQGDRSENAELTKAIEDLANINQTLADLRSALNNIQLNVRDHSNYEPVGKVVIYSTVLLRQVSTGIEYVFKLFPAGVSDLSRKILDSGSRIGQAIMLKQKGEIVVVEDALLRKPERWEIVDIY